MVKGDFCVVEYGSADTLSKFNEILPGEKLRPADKWYYVLILQHKFVHYAEHNQYWRILRVAYQSVASIVHVKNEFLCLHLAYPLVCQHMWVGLLWLFE